MNEVRIPDIGDAEDVEVIEICVAPGDAVAAEDALIVIESDKASMEVPAPMAGTVAEVLVALGDHVNEGDAIVRLDAAEDATAPALEAVPEPQGAPEPAAASVPVAVPAPPAEPSPPLAAARVDGAGKVYAGPAVRRMARELGVDLVGVDGSGVHGRILKDDVKAFVKRTLASPGPLAPALADIDFSRFGPVDEEPLGRVRARGAANLHRAWQHVVHVTQHDAADVTDLESFRAGLASEAARREVKLTPLPFIVRAVVHALKQHPRFNASLSADVGTLIVKRYYHIGIAVDTDDGLLVPVVRDADRLGVFELAAETARLASAARERKLKPDEMQGASFTISSLGPVGGTGFTPIVNAPEVAILGVARMDTRPVWDGAAFAPRQVLPLSLSYDHRAINGAEAGRFMQDLCATLGDVRRLVL